MSHFNIPDSLKKQGADQPGNEEKEKPRPLFGGPPMGSSTFGGFASSQDRQKLMNMVGSNPSGSNPFRPAGNSGGPNLFGAISKGKKQRER